MLPYSMCSVEECKERMKYKEVSHFEETDGEMDPSKMVAKYRRSAAGSAQRSPRSKEQLIKTTDYLIHLFIMLSSRENDISMVDLVHFLEDRLRAVQVDFTVLLQNSWQTQFKIAKAQILFLYLLSGQSQKTGRTGYERKFGISALETALSCYWEDDIGHHDQNTTEEMLSFSILTQLSEFLLDIESDVVKGKTSPRSLPRVWFHLVSIYRKHRGSSCSSRGQFTPLQWCMRLLSHISNGHWQCALSWIQRPVSAESPFFPLARCCIAGSIPLIRWLVLQRFNVTLSKGQRIEMDELSRLLIFSDTEECVQFVSSCGLCGDNIDQDVTAVAFKVTTMSSPDKPSTRRCDDIVFGGEHTRDWCYTSKDGVVLPSAERLRWLLDDPTI